MKQHYGHSDVLYEINYLFEFQSRSSHKWSNWVAWKYLRRIADWEEHGKNTFSYYTTWTFFKWIPQWFVPLFCSMLFKTYFSLWVNNSMPQKKIIGVYGTLQPSIMGLLALAVEPLRGQWTHGQWPLCWLATVSMVISDPVPHPQSTLTQCWHSNNNVLCKLALLFNQPASQNELTTSWGSRCLYKGQPEPTCGRLTEA